MIRILSHRLLVFTLRLGGIALGLLLLVEIGFGSLGRGSGHAWDFSLSDPVPPELTATGMSAMARLGEALLTSLPSLFIALVLIWTVGYGWGILAARLRRWGGVFLLRMPFALAACFPAFWIVILVAIYSYFVWERPGFADELRVEHGPDLIRWWNASVVALPLAFVGISRQMEGVIRVLGRHEKQLSLSSLMLLGYRYEDVFYRQVLSRAKTDLVRLLDRALPLSLGALVVVETAFQQDGVGKLFVDSVRAGFLPLVFLTSFALSVIGAGAVFLRECLVATLEAPSR